MSEQLPIQPIRPTQLPGAPARETQGKEGDGPSFAEILKGSIKEVNDLQKEANAAIEGLATGKTENVTDVMTAVEKADLAFRALMQVRNKLLDAYQEINQLRV